MKQRDQSWKYIIWILVGVLAGCRTYGTSETRQANLSAIQQANQAFAADLARAESTYAALGDTTGASQVSRAYLEDFRLAIIAHGAQLDLHRKWEAEAKQHEGSHRLLSRTLGAIVQDQQRVRDRYARLSASRAGVVDSTVVKTGKNETDRYTVAPPYYHRLANTETSK